jgi:sigma54-dependent transcription regulator
MARQRCLIGAVAEQADPLKLAQRFPALAAAIRKNISMSISLKDLGAWAELATRVQKGQVRSLPFVEGLINTVHPDFDRMHQLVQKALTAPPPKKSTPTKKPTTGTPGSTPTTPSSKAVDVKDTCG